MKLRLTQQRLHPVRRSVRQRAERLWRFVVRVLARFYDDGCFTLAGSLTYTSLLSLVPLVTIALTLFTAFPAFEAFTKSIDDFFAKNILPPVVAKTVTSYVDQFSRSATELTAVGTVFLGITAVLLMLTIEKAFDVIWRVTRPRPLGVRVLIYWATLTLGPLLIGVSLTMTSYLVSQSMGFTGQIPGGTSTLIAAIPVLLTAIAFTLLYLVVPNRPVRVPHAAIGGLVAAVLFEVMKRSFAIYVAKFPTYTLVYGAFAAVPIFLLWLYLCWVVALLGAVVVALLPDYRIMAGTGPLTPATLFRASLELLRVLLHVRREREAPTTRRLLDEARVPREIGYRALEELATCGWIARVVGDRWALACDPDIVTVADVYRRLVFDPDRARRLERDETVDALLERGGSAALRALETPLAALDAPGGEAAPPVSLRR